MRIYVAGSMKMAEAIRSIGQILRSYGHMAYVFCDPNEPAFSASMIVRKSSLVAEFTPQTAVRNPIVQNICGFNLGQLNQCDCVLLVLPSGKSAHLEAGYVVGKGKKLVIYGPMPLGEWDAMYGLADCIFNDQQTELLFRWFEEVRKEEVKANVVASH